MTKRKWTKGQTIQRQRKNGQKDKQNKDSIVCPFVHFLLVIVLFVFLSIFS
jgi:hypothetical protein